MPYTSDVIEKSLINNEWKNLLCESRVQIGQIVDGDGLSE